MVCRSRIRLTIACPLYFANERAVRSVAHAWSIIASSCFSLNSAKANTTSATWAENRAASGCSKSFQPSSQISLNHIIHCMKKKCVELIEKIKPARIKQQDYTTIFLINFLAFLPVRWHFESATSRVTNDMIFHVTREEVKWAQLKHAVVK